MGSFEWHLKFIGYGFGLCFIFVYKFILFIDNDDLCLVRKWLDQNFAFFPYNQVGKVFILFKLRSDFLGLMGRTCTELGVVRGYTFGVGLRCFKTFFFRNWLDSFRLFW